MISSVEKRILEGTLRGLRLRGGVLGGSSSSGSKDLILTYGCFHAQRIT